MCRAGRDAIVRRSVVADGRRISYLTVEGSPANPTMLLIHGSAVSARSWTYQLQGLAHALRVVAVDLPGHGESEPIPEVTVASYANAVRRLLDELGTGPVFVAGHSLGGGVAQLFATRHPDMVKALVLVSTCAKLRPSNGSERILHYLPWPIRHIVFLWMAGKILFGPGAPWRAVLLGMEELWRCAPDTIAKDAAAGMAMDLETAAQRLRVPTLIVCGSRDRLTPVALSRRLSELVSGSQLETLPAGHMVPLEVPDALSERILAFVASLAHAGEPPHAAIDRPRWKPFLRGLHDRVRTRLGRWIG